MEHAVPMAEHLVEDRLLVLERGPGNLRDRTAPTLEG